MGAKMGRPSIYTDELAKLICDIVSTTTDGLEVICANNPSLPNESTIRDWRINKPNFSTMYSIAKQNQVQFYAEETFKIAKEKSTYIDGDGNERVDPGHVAWQKMNVALRQWHAARLAPKIYGDKNEIDQLNAQSEVLKKELAELRAKLDEQHKKDY